MNDNNGFIESYRAWANKYLKEPQRRNLAVKAIDTFELLENLTKVSAAQIGPIVDAAKCPFIRVWEIGAHLLNKLAERHAAAQEALLMMLKDQKAEVRFQAVAILGRTSLPEWFAVDLIRCGLTDKSYQVRGKVAEAACQIGLKELIPELQQFLNLEKHLVARESMELAVALLRDGFLLKKSKGKLTNVWVKTDKGPGWCINLPFTDEELRTGKLESIVASVKDKPYGHLARSTDNQNE